MLTGNVLPGEQTALLSPFMVMQTARKQGILNTFDYTAVTGRFKLATIRNVYKYHPRGMSMWNSDSHRVLAADKEEEEL